MNETHVNSDQARLLRAFVAAVRASPHNLLSRRGLEELESRHVPECVAFAQGLPSAGRVLDLGTGGGFPGMVVAITRPDLAVTLLDATQKKMAFLLDFAEKHAIKVSGLVGRAEDLAPSHAASFDLVTARAVAPLDRLVPWALPFLRPGGALHAIKGERWAQELREALPVISAMRASLDEVVEPASQLRDGGTAQTPRVVIIRAPV